MIWTEWWIELSGDLVYDPNLTPPARYRWKQTIDFNPWPALPLSGNYHSDAEVTSVSDESYKLLVF